MYIQEQDERKRLSGHHEWSIVGVSSCSGACICVNEYEIVSCGGFGVCWYRVVCSTRLFLAPVVVAREELAQV